jgi:hypothetical protein
MPQFIDDCLEVCSLIGCNFGHIIDVACFARTA